MGEVTSRKFMRSPTNTRIRTASLHVSAILLALLASVSLTAQENVRRLASVKPRLIVLTDLSNEPDDEESLVRPLVYADSFDLEGLVATTSNWLTQNPREDLLHHDLDAYAKVRRIVLEVTP